MRLLGGASILSLVLSCSPITRIHGYIPEQEDLDTLLVGIDTKATIAETVGTPADSGVRDDGAWYYVSSTVETFAFNAPEVVDRTVVVLDFDAGGVLTDIARFGLDEGQIVNLQTRITPTDNRRTSILSQLLGNVGQVQIPLPE